MKGLLLKDIYMISHLYRKNLVLVLVLYSAMGLALEMSFFFQILGWMFGFYVMGLFSTDSASRWDFYAATLPVSKAALVGEKFVLLLLCSLVGLAYSLLAAPLLYWRMGAPILETAAVSAVTALVSLVYFGLMLPLAYKFGIEKARTGLLLLLAAAGAGVLALSKLEVFHQDGAGTVIRWIDQNPWMALALLAAGCAAFYLACWGVSLAIYRKKEF